MRAASSEAKAEMRCARFVLTPQVSPEVAELLALGLEARLTTLLSSLRDAALLRSNASKTLFGEQVREGGKEGRREGERTRKDGEGEERPGRRWVMEGRTEDGR